MCIFYSYTDLKNQRENHFIYAKNCIHYAQCLKIEKRYLNLRYCKFLNALDVYLLLNKAKYKRVL